MKEERLKQQGVFAIREGNGCGVDPLWVHLPFGVRSADIVEYVDISNSAWCERGLNMLSLDRLQMSHRGL